MRGAGTTPILEAPPHAHEAPPTEGEGHHAPPPRPPAPGGDFVWGGTSTTADAPASASTPVVDLFGGESFDPPPTNVNIAPPPPLAPPPSSSANVPTAVVTPLSMQQQPIESVDLFGFDSDIPEFGDQPMSAQPCVAPPPSPFGGLDFGGGGGPSPDLRAQAIANAVGVAMPMQQQPISGLEGLASPMSSLGSGLEGLNFSMPQSLSPVGPRPPFGGMMGMGGATPPASSTPGYGTPTSGMSSPAKSVSGMPMSGDLFFLYIFMLLCRILTKIITACLLTVYILDVCAIKTTYASSHLSAYLGNSCFLSIPYLQGFYCYM